jgi:blue copper oxidase
LTYLKKRAAQCGTLGLVGALSLASKEAIMRTDRTAFTRRTFLRGLAASAAVFGATPPLKVLAARPGSAAARHALYIPPILSPSNSSLEAAPEAVNLGDFMDNHWSSVLAYNGLFPGPTFRANNGSGVSVQFTNGLAEDTTVHWHGMVVPPLADGQPQDPVAPNGSYTYAFTINQRACLNWYHPHPDMLTGKQVALGLAGAFIVNDAQEASLGLPSGIYEVPLIIRDASLDSAGNMQYKPRSGGFEGPIPLVNGTLNPYLEVDTALYRFRVLGGANARIFRLALSNNAPFYLIGNDGGLLAKPVQVFSVDVAPGERVDLIVNFRGLPLETRVMLRDLRAGWDLIEFLVTHPDTGNGVVPTALSSIASLGNPVRSRQFSFDGMSKINGREFDPNRIDFEVPFGQTELWRFTTNGNAPHPVHVHGASFQVVSRKGGRNQLFPWEAGWKDTVLLEDRETVEIKIRFDGYPGRQPGTRDWYLIHCHKLEHEDMGMMANFEVV